MRGIGIRAHLPWLAIGAAIGVALSATWWVLIAREALASGEIEELVIKPGTASAIERGIPFAFGPESYSFLPGTRLRIVNRDDVEHRFAETPIPPGATADVEVDESGSFSCTIHPAGHLDVSLQDRPPWPAMAVLTGALSLSVATVAWVIRGAS